MITHSSLSHSGEHNSLWYLQFDALEHIYSAANFYRQFSKVCC